MEVLHTMTSKTNSNNISINILKKELKKGHDYAAEKKKKKELYEAKEWYTIRAVLGNTWANWFVLIGARER